MTPPPHPDDLPTIGAAIAAVKPVYWLLVGAAGLAFGVAGFVDRIERIEQNVHTITLILCADATAAADTYCKGARR